MSQSENSDVNPYLQNKRIFNDTRLIWGIPSNVFMFGVLLAVIPLLAAFMVDWKITIVSILMGTVYFSFMYQIHKYDDKALLIYFKNWLSPNQRLVGYRPINRTLYLYKERVDDIKLKTWGMK